VLLLISPFVGAASAVIDGTTAYQKVVGGTVGLGYGLARGVIGSTSLLLAGVLSGGNKYDVVEVFVMIMLSIVARARATVLLGFRRSQG
jgi:hypothetical protein